MLESIYHESVYQFTIPRGGFYPSLEIRIWFEGSTKRQEMLETRLALGGVIKEAIAESERKDRDDLAAIAESILAYHNVNAVEVKDANIKCGPVLYKNWP